MNFTTIISSSGYPELIC